MNGMFKLSFNKRIIQMLHTTIKSWHYRGGFHHLSTSAMLNKCYPPSKEVQCNRKCVNRNNFATTCGLSPAWIYCSVISQSKLMNMNQLVAIRAGLYTFIYFSIYFFEIEFSKSQWLLKIPKASKYFKTKSKG